MKLYKLFMRYILIIGIAIGAFLLWNAARNDAYMTAYADCIAREARAVDYKGTDAQAWELFAPKCK